MANLTTDLRNQPPIDHAAEAAANLRTEQTCNWTTSDRQRIIAAAQAHAALAQAEATRAMVAAVERQTDVLLHLRDEFALGHRSAASWLTGRGAVAEDPQVGRALLAAAIELDTYAAQLAKGTSHA